MEKILQNLKTNYTEVLIEKIEPISRKIKELLNDEKYLDTILFRRLY